MDEWPVDLWIVGALSFQKIYGLYCLIHHILEIIGNVTNAGRTKKQQARADRATQLLMREMLSFGICGD